MYNKLFYLTDVQWKKSELFLVELVGQSGAVRSLLLHSLWWSELGSCQDQYYKLCFATLEFRL